MEARWETIPAGEGGDWSLLALPNDKAEKNDFEIAVPEALGLILELKTKLSEPVQGLKAFAPEDRPHQIGLIYYAFRIMIAIGFFLAALMGMSTWQWLRESCRRHHWRAEVVDASLDFCCAPGLHCHRFRMDCSLRRKTALDSVWRNTDD